MAGLLRNKKKIHDLESGITPFESGSLSVLNLHEDDIGNLEHGYFTIDLNEFGLSVYDLRFVTWSLATGEGGFTDIGGFRIYEDPWVNDGIRITSGRISSLNDRIAIEDISDQHNIVPAIGDRNISINTADNKLFIGGTINCCAISLFYEKGVE